MNFNLRLLWLVWVVIFLTCPSMIMAQSVPDDAKYLTTNRNNRTLLFIPLTNNTGDDELDYLSYSMITMLFSSMRSNFLIGGEPLTDRFLRPVPVERSTSKQESSLVLLTTKMLDFRSAELREKQKNLPKEFSMIPAKKKELQELPAPDIALKYGAEWFIHGTIDYEPVDEKEYVDPQGRRIKITPEIRKQFEGKDIPEKLKELLQEQKPKKLFVTMTLSSFESRSDLWSHRFVLSIDNPFAKDEAGRSSVTDIAAQAGLIDEQIRSKNPHWLRLRSEKTGYVFFNDTFAGKTPLNIRVPDHRLKIRIEQDGCDHYHFNWSPGTAAELKAGCTLTKGRSVLSVVSLPDGADVYLDQNHIGTTPLRRSDLKAGVHRVRVSKEGYIDGFYGVQLKDNDTVEVVASLKEGNTVAYYTDPGYVLADWTNDDFAQGLFFQSIAFGLGWAYSDSRARSILDSVRSPLVPFFWPDSNAGLTLGLYQHLQLEDARLRALKWQRSANTMAGLGVASLLGAGFYLYRSLKHDDRPFGEIEVGLSNSVETGFGERRSFATGIEFRFRFD